MALVLNKLYHGYVWIFRDMADPRTDDTFLVSSPLAQLLIILGYLYIVKNLGPKLMENRQPFDIKNVIRVYNAVQVVANAYVTIVAWNAISKMDWSCAPVDYSDRPGPRRVIHAALVFYALKILDLMDTVFFVLRKSYRQISFLHIYHHSMMVLCLWIGIRYVAGGESLWIALINSFVHVVMYFYYLLTTFDNKWKNTKYKKYITQLQFVQFFTLFVIYARLLMKPSCAYPKWVSFLFVPQNLFMILLFGDFYRKTYLSKKTQIK